MTKIASSMVWVKGLIGDYTHDVVNIHYCSPSVKRYVVDWEGLGYMPDDGLTRIGYRGKLLWGWDW